ncbi:hypothetical protein N9P38_01305 [Flavobacteriales bacterium]|nr:hypothetical protein [Flavobacteriales bacterium]MDB4088467.1 hypothetical protein [Flavobacteriales bacterium]
MKLFPFVIALVILLNSCFSEPVKSKKPSKSKINEKEFLNHEIINDSIEVRIKEFNERNLIYRNLCVFKNDEVFKEHLIYKVKKKEIFDEGYNTEIKKMYEVKDKHLVEIYDYTFHYFDYSIEDIDTNITKIVVTPQGEINVIN